MIKRHLNIVESSLGTCDLSKAVTCERTNFFLRLFVNFSKRKYKTEEGIDSILDQSYIWISLISDYFSFKRSFVQYTKSFSTYFFVFLSSTEKKVKNRNLQFSISWLSGNQENTTKQSWNTVESSYSSTFL